MLASCFHMNAIHFCQVLLSFHSCPKERKVSYPEPSLPLPLTLIHHNFQPATLDKLLLSIQTFLPLVSSLCFLFKLSWIPEIPFPLLFLTLTVLRISINTVQISPSPKLFWNYSMHSMLSSLTLDIALRSIDPHYSNYHILYHLRRVMWV